MLCRFECNVPCSRGQAVAFFNSGYAVGLEYFVYNSLDMAK